MSERVVLDAFAILALLGEEPGWEMVRDVLVTGEPWMTLVALGEVAYVLERRRGAEAADEVWDNLLAPERPDGVPVRWLPVDERVVRASARLKARGGISYADAVAAGAAQLLECPVLTGDPEFRVAEEAGIAVLWIGDRRAARTDRFPNIVDKVDRVDRQ